MRREDLLGDFPNPLDDPPFNSLVPEAGLDRRGFIAGVAWYGPFLPTPPAMPHGFNADYRPSYRKNESEDAWKRAFAWFKKHGVA